MDQIINKIAMYVEKMKVGDYEVEYFSFHRSRFRFLLKELEKYPRNFNLLDIGAGDMYLLMGAKELGFNKLHAVERFALSELLSERCRVFGIKPAVCDLKINKLPYENNFFDLIFLVKRLNISIFTRCRFLMRSFEF